MSKSEPIKKLVERVESEEINRAVEEVRIVPG